MPLLHFQFNSQSHQKLPDGTLVTASVSPALLLTNSGPRVQVSIMLIDQMALQLNQQGRKIEPPVSGSALIDTGAAMTCIDEEAAVGLKLQPIDIVKMASASHSSHDANVYPIQMQIAGLPFSLNIPRTMGAALKAQGLIALIGRDILSRCLLVYNGMSGEFTIGI